MDAKQNLYELQMEYFEIFKAQNPDDFDVAFEIDGKKLYADKYKLSKISPTYKSMLSDRWTSKDESIKIENYSYENFKEFLTFIYSVKKCFFLFSGDELSDILCISQNKIFVRILDENEKMMKGVLNCPEIGKISDVIASLKNKPREGNFYWRARQTKPSEPSKLIKNSGIEWYLVYDRDGDVAIKHQNAIDSDDYLLAEMFEEDEFLLNGNCKIEIYRC